MTGDRENRPALHFAFGAALLLIVAWFSTRAMPSGGALVYSSDSVYVNLATARNLLEHGSFGFADERLPAQTDSAWRLLIAVAARAGVPLLAAPQIVAFVGALVGLIALLSMVRVIAPRTAWSWWIVAAWISMIPTVADALDGSSAYLAGAFAALGFAASARGLAAGRSPLPLAAAFWLGLSALFRVELLALWIALVVLALVLSIAKRIETGVPTIAVQALNGGIMAAILLAPVIWWNTVSIGVPWPPAPDAALTANALAAGASLAGSFSSGLAQGFSAAFGGPLWNGVLTRLFIVAGIVWLIVDMVRRRAEWSASVLLAGVVLPPAFALLHPLLGAEGLAYLQRAAQLIWILPAGYAVLRTAEVMRDIAHEKIPTLSPRLIFLSAMLLLGAIPVLAGLREQMVLLRELRAAKQRAHEQRVALAERLGAPDQAGGIAADEPGWLMFQRYAPVTDLSGRLQPVVLNWLRGGGVSDEASLRDYLSRRGVRRAVVWREPKNLFGSLFQCPPGETGGPMVCSFSPTAIP